MMHRQGELSLDIAVTAKAQIRLRFFEEAVVQPARCFGKLRHLEKGRLRQRGATPALIFNHFHQVDRVAFAAGDARRRVLVGDSHTFLIIGGWGVAAGVVFLALSPWLKRWAHGADDAANHPAPDPAAPP